jgi:amino acid permease
METEPRDGHDLLIGGAISMVLNLGFLLIAKGDQRILLLLFATVIVGLVSLATPKGAYGMGIILGAMVACVIALALAGFAHWSPLTSNARSTPDSGVTVTLR